MNASPAPVVSTTEEGVIANDFPKQLLSSHKTGFDPSVTTTDGLLGKDDEIATGLEVLKNHSASSFASFINEAFCAIEIILFLS